MQDKVKRRSLFAGVAVVAAAAGLGGAWWRQRDEGSVAASPSGESLPDELWGQALERPEGGELHLKHWRGKPMLINFWATWCPPCVEEMPLLDAFAREQGPNGVQVLGLAIDQPSAVRKFLQRTPVQFPTALAGLNGTQWVRTLGNANGGLPFSVLLNRSGEVLARKMGKLEPEDLSAWSRAQVHG